MISSGIDRRHGQDEQSSQPLNAMHQSNRKGARAEAMRVVVRFPRPQCTVASMRTQMEMSPIAVAVPVGMDALALQAP